MILIRIFKRLSRLRRLFILLNSIEHFSKTPLKQLSICRLMVWNRNLKANGLLSYRGKGNIRKSVSHMIC